MLVLFIDPKLFSISRNKGSDLEEDGDLDWVESEESESEESSSDSEWEGTNQLPTKQDSSEKSRKYRQNMTPDQRQRYNEKARARMRKMRQAKKEHDRIHGRPKLSASAQAKLRKKWR